MESEPSSIKFALLNSQGLSTKSNPLTKVKSLRNGLLQTFVHCSNREIGPLLATTGRFP